MAARFRCGKCAHQFHLEPPLLESVACPSCGVRLRKSHARPAWFHDPRLPGAALGGGAVLALLLLALVALGWVASGKQRQRDTVARESATVVAAPVLVAPVVEPAVASEQPAGENSSVRQAAIEETAVAPTLEKHETALPPFKRRDIASAEDLRQQLLLAPEVALDSVAKTATELHTLAKKAAASNATFRGPAELLGHRPDLRGLPLRMGGDCHLAKEPAENLDQLSDRLRPLLKSGDAPADVARLRVLLLDAPNSEWLRTEAVPCLVQMMQVQDESVRKVLVEALGKIADKQATRALAKRALADLSPEVREAAARALLGRPPEDYRPLLLGGLRYPWAPVAIHAAETLAFVKDQNAVPELVKMLGKPDPTQPFISRQDGKETPLVRELVRVNHLSNCLLCHPASFSKTDRVRGAVPTPGQALSSGGGYSGGKGSNTILVRADTTYLKQDFSVMQPVPNHGQWPEEQRYDYLVRTRPATMQEMEAVTSGNLTSARIEARLALRFALHEITGKEYALDGRELASVR